MKKLALGFLVGALLFSIMPVKAAIEEYICYKADYKVVVNGVEYTNSDLPILNYKGNTYAPFRSILEAAGLTVNWNAESGQAEVIDPSSQSSNVQSGGGEGETVADTQTITQTPDGLRTIFRNDKVVDGKLVADNSYYVSLDDIYMKYKDKGFSMDFNSPTTFNLIKSDEVVIENIPRDGFVVGYDYYVDSMLSLLQQ